MIAFPNAKINIGLNVVSKRKDGYHNLETIFYPVTLTDALEINRSVKYEFSLSGIEIDGDPQNNLVARAYRILQNEHDLPPVKMHLHKAIPYGAGLGGGSSDGAFTLQLINKLFQLRIPEHELKSKAALLGADCPFFLENRPVFATGTGDRFKPVELDLSNYHILIVKPRIEVNTADAYRDISPKRPGFNLQEIASLPLEKWKEVIKNDFEKSVFRKHPEIETLKEKLYDMGALYAAMSGSGSSLFGIFRHSPVNPEKSLPEGIYIYR